MENQTPPQEQKQKVNRLLLALVILFAGLSCYFAWLSFDKGGQIETMNQENTTLTNEKKAVEGELEGMIAQYEDMKSQNETLNEELAAEQAKIEEMLQKAKNQNWTIYKLRKETETLRNIMKGYIHTIDSLNTLNQELIVEKAQVEQKLSSEKERSSELEQKNENLADQVKIGAKLKALDMMAVAQRVKSNGIHRETNRANKAEKIKCCFTIDKNELTKPGKKKVYLRIVDPNGKILCEKEDETFMFEYEGKKGLYSTMKIVEYKGGEEDVCMYWDVQGELIPGEYIVEAYAQEFNMGTVRFTLK